MDRLFDCRGALRQVPPSPFTIRPSHALDSPFRCCSTTSPYSLQPPYCVLLSFSSLSRAAAVPCPVAHPRTCTAQVAASVHRPCCPPNPSTSHPRSLDAKGHMSSCAKNANGCGACCFTAKEQATSPPKVDDLAAPTRRAIVEADSEALPLALAMQSRRGCSASCS